MTSDNQFCRKFGCNHKFCRECYLLIDSSTLGAHVTIAGRAFLYFPIFDQGPILDGKKTRLKKTGRAIPDSRVEMFVKPTPF